MKNEMTLEVAQHPVSLVLSDPVFFGDIAKSYGGFLSDRDPKATIEVHIVDDIPRGKSNGARVTFTNRGMEVSHASFCGSVDLVKGWGELYTVPEELAFSLKIVLRYLFTCLHLREGNGLALHALGVIKEGEAYAFFGPSGSGKTTAAGLSAAHTILSDDLVFLQYSEGSHWVHPTPTWGDMQRGKRENRPYPLKAIFKLIKAAEITIRRTYHAKALADVITLPHLPKDFNQPDILLSGFLRLVREVPYYELRFTKGRSFWPCIDENLRKIGTENAK